MRVRQYAYFSLASDRLTPDEITATVGMEPDRALARGAKSPGPPPLPRRHLWDVRSELPDDVRIDDHIEVLILRLWDAADRIRAIVDESSTDDVLRLVRYFDAFAREDVDIATRGVPEGVERLSGQHPLLGIHLDRRTVAFVDHVRAVIDVDEYGDDDD